MSYNEFLWVSINEHTVESRRLGELRHCFIVFINEQPTAVLQGKSCKMFIYGKKLVSNPMYVYYFE